MSTIRIFSPATVANVSCGFDAMAFALSDLGDEMWFSITTTKEVRITVIEGADLPFEVQQNAAAFVAHEMLKSCDWPFGLEIKIKKNYLPGSGLGSSAASSAGAAVAVNKLLNDKFSNLELTQFAMLGEEVACGSRIADNVAAAIYGRFVLIRSYEPLEIVNIPTPENLFVAVVHPQIEIRTEEARSILPKEISLKKASAQWANVGGLISGLYQSDYDLIGRSIVDYAAEPYRKKLIPHFDTVKEMAMKSGALGVGISGSGPSIFALCKGLEISKNVAEAMSTVYQSNSLEVKSYVSSIGKEGVKELKTV